MVTKAATQPDLASSTNPATPDPLPTLGAIQHTDDVVEYTLNCVLAMAPGLSEAIRQHIKKATNDHVRSLFGGERAYVSRRPGDGRFARNAQIRRDYKAGERIPLLQRRYNLSPARLWQIINE